MSSERRGPGLGLSLLVAGVLLLTAGGVALAVVPAADCPLLASRIERTMASNRPQHREKITQCLIRSHRNRACEVCRKSCRVPLIRLWLAPSPAKS